MKIRFVTCRDAISTAIRLRSNFWASHCEALMPDGKNYLGAHADGGVALRPVGYDNGVMKQELLVDLPSSPEIDAEFYAFLGRHLGEPYDFASIVGFIVPDVYAHQAQHIICSALQTLALRQCEWFAAPLAEPAHKISPRDLLLMISGRVAIDKTGWKL